MTYSATVPATAPDALRQIRVTLKILGVFQLMDKLDAQCLADAEADIEAALLVLDRAVHHGTATLPILRLGEVAAPFDRLQAPRAGGVTALRSIDGGRK